ncbi:MAG TPA: hypothetical protein VGK77_13140 [Candidatus Binatia bacterium]|jgi:hypothetical protein
MDWEVRITGSQVVLGHLVDVLKDREPSLVRDGDTFVLRAKEFQTLADGGSVQARAKEIVEALSTLARLGLQSVESLEVGNVTRVREDGRRDYFLNAESGHLRITGGLTSMVVKRADGTVQEHKPADAIPAWLSKALLDPTLLRALRLRDSDALAWPDLYRLFEVIEAGLGGESGLVARGSATRDTVRRFCHSANSVAAAGDQARHGVERTEPPARPMTISEARSFVDGLLRHWLGENGI